MSSIGNNIKLFNRFLTIWSHTCSVLEYLNYIVSYLHSLETVILDLHPTQAVWDCTTYYNLLSFWLKGL